jgi:hypothetical protein
MLIFNLNRIAFCTLFTYTMVCNILICLITTLVAPPAPLPNPQWGGGFNPMMMMGGDFGGMGDMKDWMKK